MPESHEVDWTDEKVAAFWEEPRSPDSYFSAVVGPALAGWIRRHVRPKGLIVDVGCGPGHLLAELKQFGYDVFGVDGSSENLRHAALRLGADRVGVGSLTSLPLGGGTAATVLLVETIEHVLDKDLGAMMREIVRVLTPNGTLVVTTPNAEDLDAAKVVCPDCRARFHPVQHVRSWNAQSLRSFMEVSGFSSVRTFETHLPNGRGLMALQRRLRFQARGSRPNLLAIAQIGPGK